MSSNHVRSEIIGEFQGWDASMEARRENREIEKQIQRRRTTWQLHPPSNMVVIMRHSAGAFRAGLTLSVQHDVGCILLHKRLCNIVEHDSAVDAVIDGGLEQAVAVMELGIAEVITS